MAVEVGPALHLLWSSRQVKHGSIRKFNWIFLRFGARAVTKGTAAAARESLYRRRRRPRQDHRGGPYCPRAADAQEGSGDRGRLPAVDANSSGLDELEQRFGLPFEILDKDFIPRIRRERGLGVNPWTAHFPFSHLALRYRGNTSPRKVWTESRRAGRPVSATQRFHQPPWKTLWKSLAAPAERPDL